MNDALQGNVRTMLACAAKATTRMVGILAAGAQPYALKRTDAPVSDRCVGGFALHLREVFATQAHPHQQGAADEH